MSKTVNEVLVKLPLSEKINLTFDNGKTVYVVTVGKDGTYYLYQKTEKGYQYKKSRKKDPCFPECY